jgi:hypothetical protein
MATKAQKRAAAEAKRAAFEAEVKASGLRAQEEDRRVREARSQAMAEEIEAINHRHREILALYGLVEFIRSVDG